MSNKDVKKTKKESKKEVKTEVKKTKKESKKDNKKSKNSKQKNSQEYNDIIALVSEKQAAPTEFNPTIDQMNDDFMENLEDLSLEMLYNIASSKSVNKKDMKKVNKAIRDAERMNKENELRLKREQKKYEKALSKGRAEEDPFRKQFNSFEEIESYFIERDAEICSYILDTNPQFLRQLILSDDKELVDFVCYVNKPVFTRVDFNALHLTYDEDKLDNFRIIAKELLSSQEVLEKFRNAKYRGEQNLLEAAIIDRKNKYIEALLNSNYPLDNAGGVEYIMQAIEADNLEAMKLLADHGAHLNVRYEDGTTLLQTLARMNDMDKFMTLLIRGADYKNTNVEGQDLVTYLHDNNRHDFRRKVLEHIENGGNSAYNENFRFNNGDSFEDLITEGLHKDTIDEPRGSTIGAAEEALRIQNENTKLELEKMKFHNEIELEKMKLSHEKEMQEKEFEHLKENIKSQKPEESDDDEDMEFLNNGVYGNNRTMKVKKVSQYVSPHMIPDPDRARRIRDELKALDQSDPNTSGDMGLGKPTYGRPNNVGLVNRQIAPMNQGYTGRVPNRATTRSTNGYNSHGYTSRLVGNKYAGKNQSMNGPAEYGKDERVKYDLLRHLKILFDEEVITYDEYVLEKGKILGHFEQ